jgi:hypothetical protein
MQDRVPIEAQKNQVLLIPVFGEKNVYDLVIDDGADAQHQGDLMNKAFWLDDDTAELVFDGVLPSGKNRDTVLVSDAWIQIVYKASQSAEAIGEIVYALQSPDISQKTKNRWLPCDGDWGRYDVNIKYPELDNMLVNPAASVPVWVFSNIDALKQEFPELDWETGKYLYGYVCAQDDSVYCWQIGCKKALYYTVRDTGYYEAVTVTSPYTLQSRIYPNSADLYAHDWPMNKQVFFLDRFSGDIDPTRNIGECIGNGGIRNKKGQHYLKGNASEVMVEYAQVDGKLFWTLSVDHYDVTYRDLTEYLAVPKTKCIIQRKKPASVETQGHRMDIDFYDLGFDSYGKAFAFIEWGVYPLSGDRNPDKVVEIKDTVSEQRVMDYSLIVAEEPVIVYDTGDDADKIYMRVADGDASKFYPVTMTDTNGTTVNLKVDNFMFAPLSGSLDRVISSRLQGNEVHHYLLERTKGTSQYTVNTTDFIPNFPNSGVWCCSYSKVVNRYVAVMQEGVCLGVDPTKSINLANKGHFRAFVKASSTDVNL